MNRAVSRSLPAALLLTSLLTAMPSTGSRAQTATRKSHALLVGINKYQSEEVNPVKGAKEDVHATKTFLQTVYDFPPDDIHTLTDSQATKQAILTEFQHWLIDETRPGDRVFFLFSGHGSNVRDVNGDETDGRDETIVPYDVRFVPPNGTVNQILDDELEGLIQQLSGRLAVLVFDSCHSGTISRAPGGKPTDEAGPRFLPSPEAWATLRTGARGSGNNTSAYQVNEAQDKQLVTRDLKLVKEKLRDSVSGVVVISAAQAHQLAYPVKLNDGGYRGALSYLLCETLARQKTLTVKELCEQMTQQFAALQAQQKLRGQQRPAIEILSKYKLDNLPLFAGAQAQVEYELPLANPASKLRVELRTNEGTLRYQLGNDISYTLKTSAPGWVYLLVFSQENVATCIYPTDNADSYHAAGTLRLPATDAFEVKEPLGKDVTIALLSSVKLGLGNKETMSWDEVFERLHSNKLANFVNTRGVGTKKPSQPPTASLDEADWQAASLVIETIAKPAGPQRPAKSAKTLRTRRTSFTPNRSH